MKPLNPVMVIDNDEGLCRLIDAILTDSGYTVRVFTNPYEAVTAFRNGQFSLVITDIKMPGMDGIEVLEQVKRTSPVTPVIIITAHATVDISIQALRKGAEDMLTKPFESAELLLRVNNVLRHNALLKENIQLKQELLGRFRFENIIGVSPAVKDILDKVEKVAPRDLPVLIIGESGTGKELVAQAIHYNSPRKDKPFIAINCGALPQALMESELFGHKKGAFTGATEDKAGLIELAGGGTLFLDEVGNLTVDAQKGLLRFLQEKELRRVGDSRTIRVDVRVISATNADLRSVIRTGAFREDLYYRLNGITVTIPPLRERVEDIPLLVAHFVALQNKRFGTDCSGITADGMQALMQYYWPGNVRQLKNVIEAAMALGSGRHIGLDVLKQFIEIPEQPADADDAVGDYSENLSRFEREYFRSTLARCSWNVDDAARLAGVNIATLYRKIKKYGLRKE